MSRVCVSVRTGAAIYVFAEDHCPPHIHARHRGEGWIARVEFSFVTNEVRLISVTPVRNTPLPRVIGQLLDDVQDALHACRAEWWAMRGMTCLTNRWAVRERQSLTLPPEHRPDAMQVEKADYNPVNHCLRIVFKGGATFVMEAGSGIEPV